MTEITPAEFDSVAEQITGDGQEIADRVMRRAAGSPHVALAILGVAAIQIFDGMKPKRRAEVLRDWLESFE